MSVRHAVMVDIYIECSECGQVEDSICKTAAQAAERFEDKGWIDDGEGGALCRDCARDKRPRPKKRS